nr:hypothetical protein GCM10020185_87540 [Pseudomonas brassicacearum subsp. brassicacearum]
MEKNSIDVGNQFRHLHHVLERALAWDNSRYADASKFLEEFNNALKPIDTGAAILKRLETFKSIGSQRQLFRQYPDEVIISDDDFKTIWIAEKKAKRDFLGNCGKRASWSDGGIDQPRILDFLEKKRDNMLTHLRRDAYSFATRIGCQIHLHLSKTTLMHLV